MGGKTGEKSAVWLYFTAVSADEAKCDICKVTLSCKGGTTSNLRKHLNSKHPTVIIEDRINVSATSAASSSVVLPVPDCPPNFGSSPAKDQSARISKGTVSSRVSSTFSSMRQSTMCSYVVCPMSVIRQKKINNLILNMNIMDWNLAMLNRTLLPQKYGSTVQALKMHMSKAESITLTTDGGTSTANRAYLAITAHFI
ncbi:hypothetical protein J437_LFUL016844 [Ladona fulva]|uniref:BED-type domain-containing protein n=1 Tax=Ladona fulva TaxID=123851 RepID=A0A8K0KKM6_LADFU|nr:hypothetical protein J437_LFUL016844 [Ladona fulva]